MSKRAKLLLRENNELEEQIRDEAARAALTDMIVYIRSANISAYNQELVRRDIWQMIADGERRGESVEEIIGGDYKAFCDSVIAELPQLSPAERLLSQLRDTLLSAVVLLAIWLAFDILAVSYTQLDVYKRQPPREPSLRPCSASTTLSASSLTTRAWALPSPTSTPTTPRSAS